MAIIKAKGNKMQQIETLVSTLSGIIWGPIMLTLLVGTGLYLTILLKGIQFRVLPHAFRLIFKKKHMKKVISAILQR